MGTRAQSPCLAARSASIVADRGVAPATAVRTMHFARFTQEAKRMKTVVGMFKDASEARSSFDDLTRLGIDPNDVSVVQLATKQSAGLGLSAVKSGDDGSMMAARGPLAMRLGRQRGLISTLSSAGVSDSLIDHYLRALKLGETLEAVTVEDRAAPQVEEIMKRHAASYYEGASASAAPITSGVATQSTYGTTSSASTGAIATGPSRMEKLDGEQIIPVLREEIQIGKRVVDRGATHVGIHVTERPVSEHVRLREEYVEVERRPANRAPTPGELEFRKTEIDLSASGEEAVVSKQVRVVEEVHLRKKVVERDETISDTLRGTDIDITDPQDLLAYSKHYGSLGFGNFEAARPAYDYGRGLRSAGNRWEDVEGRARTAWEQKNPGTWDKFKESIRFAWMRSREGKR
jgi:stress response protein YsnF